MRFKLLAGLLLGTCLLFSSGFAAMLSAEETLGETIVKKEQIDCVDELDAVKTAIGKNSSMLKTFGGDSIKSEPVTRSSNADPLETGYRLHFVTSRLLNAYETGKTVADIIPDEYIWRFPTANGGKVSVEEDDGVWKVSGVSSGSSDEDFIPDIVDKRVVANVISSEAEKLAGAGEVTYINDPTCYTNFAYLVSGETEYLIPCGTIPEFTGLENGKVYTFKEVVDTLKQHYGDEELDPFSDAGVGGIFSNQVSAEDPAAPAEAVETQQTNIWVVYIVAASVLFVSVCIVVCFLMHNKRKNKG